MLSHEEAKAFYDRLGRRQDWQAVFEDRAVEDMIKHGQFGRARAVCEFGCGTGRLAQRLLQEFLPHDSSYVGLDISETMVALARNRLSPWKERASILQTDGTAHVPLTDGGFDRFLACYVLDLLSGQDIRDLLSEAHRVLGPEGLLCLVSLTRGQTTASKILTSFWERLHAWRPALVGGCRPLELRAHLCGVAWQLEHRRVISRFGVSSEVIVAARISSRLLQA
jgi:ubiquinone/menaquinone biosynthesis C-methylase UbiE